MLLIYLFSFFGGFGRVGESGYCQVPRIGLTYPVLAPPRSSPDPVYCVCGGTGLAKVRVRIREPVNPEIKIERAKVPLQIAVCGNFDIIGHVSRIFQRYTSHYAPCDMAYFCAHACAHAYRMLIDACNLI